MRRGFSSKRRLEVAPLQEASATLSTASVSLCLFWQVMSGLERQIAKLSSREQSTTSIAKESKQKVGRSRRDSRPSFHSIFMFNKEGLVDKP